MPEADLSYSMAMENEAVPTRHGIRKGIYLIPAIFTLANLGMGFFAIMESLRAFQLVGIGEAERAAALFDNASKAIGWAVLFDGIDGRIARMTRSTTEIGIQLDSLADVLTFGIAPAVLAYTWGYGAPAAEGSEVHGLGWFVSFLYLTAGTFRLARFNVQANRPRVMAEGSSKLDKKSFVGLPIPAGAGLIAAMVHFSPLPFSVYDSTLYSGLLILLIAALSILMVSTFRYSSFKGVGTGRWSTRVIVFVLASIGMITWLYSKYVLLGIAIAYVLHGVVFRLFAIVRRKSDTPAEA
jgi:CDP-diacylglycerol---serine O-phosphatidyltransferase